MKYKNDCKVLVYIFTIVHTGSFKRYGSTNQRTLNSCFKIIRIFHIIQISNITRTKKMYQFNYVVVTNSQI